MFNFNKKPNPIITLGNGLRISVQASSSHYCKPQEDYLSRGEEYTEMEIGPISQKNKKFMPLYILQYEEKPFDSKVKKKKEQTLAFPYVPVEDIKKFIQESGGIVKGCLPTGERIND